MSADEGLDRWLAAAWAVEAEPFSVTVDGAAIACRGWNLAAADLPLLILVHGYRAHARWWDHIAPSLTQAHRVVALDLSGMGDSDRRAAYSREQHGREISGVARALTNAPAVLVTHSFGSMGGLIACRQEPERFSRLIIIDSGIPTPADVGHQMSLSPRRVYPDAASALARFRLIPPGLWPSAAVLDHIARHALCEAADGWTWKFDEKAAASLNLEAYYDKLFGIIVPVYVIHGEHSEIMTPERRAQLRAMAPVQGEICIPASHHHIMIEQPIALVTALLGLLACKM
ncbi:MAG: alpha/beta hydrolase [Sphingobium sp.]